MAANRSTATKLSNTTIAQAFFWLMKGSLSQAKTFFNQAINEDKVEPRQIISDICEKGASLLDQMEYEKALNCYNLALEFEPENFSIICGVGLVLLKQAKYEKAITNFNNVLKKQPKNILALDYKGYALLLQRDPAAIDFFQNALSINPNDSGLIAEKGLAQFFAGNYDQADECFTFALALASQTSTTDHTYAVIYAKIGTVLLYYYQKNEVMAEEIFESLMLGIGSKQELELEVLLLKAIGFLALNKSEAADVEFKKLLAKFPQSEAVKYHSRMPKTKPLAHSKNSYETNMSLSALITINNNTKKLTHNGFKMNSPYLFPLLTTQKIKSILENLRLSFLRQPEEKIFIPRPLSTQQNNQALPGNKIQKNIIDFLINLLTDQMQQMEAFSAANIYRCYTLIDQYRSELESLALNMDNNSKKLANDYADLKMAYLKLVIQNEALMANNHNQKRKFQQLSSLYEKARVYIETSFSQLKETQNRITKLEQEEKILSETWLNLGESNEDLTLESSVSRRQFEIEKMKSINHQLELKSENTAKELQSLRDQVNEVKSIQHQQLRSMLFELYSIRGGKSINKEKSANSQPQLLFQNIQSCIFSIREAISEKERINAQLSNKVNLQDENIIKLHNEISYLLNQQLETKQVHRKQLTDILADNDALKIQLQEIQASNRELESKLTASQVRNKELESKLVESNALNEELRSQLKEEDGNLLEETLSHRGNDTEISLLSQESHIALGEMYQALNIYGSSSRSGTPTLFRNNTAILNNSVDDSKCTKPTNSNNSNI